MKIKMKNLEAALAKTFSPGQPRKSRGPLHDRMSQFLPDFVDEGENCCNLQRLAIALEMTPQGVYKIFRPGRTNRVSPNVVDLLVELSSLTKKRSPGFRPATVQDFWDFVSV